MGRHKPYKHKQSAVASLRRLTRLFSIIYPHTKTYVPIHSKDL